LREVVRIETVKATHSRVRTGMREERLVVVFSIIGALAAFLTALLALGVSGATAVVYSLLVVVVVLLAFLLFKVGDIGKRLDAEVGDVKRGLDAVGKRLDAHDTLALVAYEFSEGIIGEGVRRLSRRESWSLEDFASTFVDRLWEAHSRASKMFASLGLRAKYELSSEELRSLLDKYERGELTDVEEAKRLWLLLKEEKNGRLERGDIAAAVFIGALMLAIGAFILAQLLRKE